MSADSLDAFPYETSTRLAGKAMRRHYWATAIGLQAVDGLEVSPYLRELAQSYEQGRCTLQETGELIRAYHTAEGSDRQATAEADLVSQRIAEMLEAGSFAFTPDMLLLVHRTLFQDMDEEAYRPGQYKTERLVKQEDILNGDSVLYADPTMIQTSLDYLFREESRESYGTSLSETDVARLAKFVSLLWQVHPFVEGNTRTVAVFSELYLGSLGFTVGNEPFQKHARYYRDALVRANYRNNEAGILPERGPLEAFYGNLLLDAGHPLNREELICPELFDNPQLLKHIGPSRALKAHS
ncbi:Fic family protein [Enterorhabdus sp. P55]|uniref:Fic family protein n=1 Tax=Enterorhabdus sp. P55 TaxID=2304571 RepID=UPI00136AF11B|nr:Fic family protein [Enterorhabdus sp. P55]NBI32677.1 cell filamentation protein Fic [Enterorhabdus sp. P55]